MRKLSSISLVTVILGALLIAGCGGGSGSSGASSPLDDALRYLPADTPFAVAIDTDTEGEQFGSAGDVVERFPGSEGIQKLAQKAIESRTGDFEKLQQALGNEFVVGSTDPKTFIDSSSGDDQAFVGAIQAKSQDALDQLVDEQKPEEDGELDGAKLYKDDSGDSFAIDGDVLLIAGSRKELEQALATRDGDDSLTEEDFDAGTQGVAKDALLRVYLNVEELLAASPDAKDALQSKWVKAVRTAGLALAFSSDRIAIDLGVKTDPSGLTDADLPIASGPDSPQVLDRGRGIHLALRDPGHVLEFAQATAKAIDPEAFSSFEAGKAQIERQLKIDVDDVVAQLDGNLALTIGLDGKFGARAQLKAPAVFEDALKKLEPVLPSIAEGATGEKIGFAKPKAGESFYAIATAGGNQIVFGVVDGEFVISNSPAIAGALAAAKTKPVPGAEGALVMSADATQLAETALSQAQGQAKQRGFDLGDLIESRAITKPLDTLIGSIEATTDGLTGGFELSVEPKKR